ncbi:probable cytochrome P450 CYP44 [Patella vulgata]|uniref:probable cytochrome P450 CYP44 n=1 Tax=Patella vulgata TaxID=6465 RepID=UPI0021809008|nr:probable cytochrome P450 CYP44 [Patella vulgata]
MLKLQTRHRPITGFGHQRRKLITSTRSINDEEEIRSAKSFHEIPSPQGLPYIGNLHKYIVGSLNKYKYQNVLKQYFDTYGPIFKQTLAGRTTVHICHPSMFQIVYKDEGKVPTILPLLETSKKFRTEEKMSPGLGNTNGEEWYRLRTAVQKHMMKPGEVSAYLTQTNEVANDFVENLARLKNVNNFLQESSKWSLETSGYNCFGRRLGYLHQGTESEQEALRIIKMNDIQFSLSTDLKFSLPLYKYYKTATYKKLFEAEETFTGIADAYLDEALQNIDTQITNGNDETIAQAQVKYKFILALMQSKNISRKDIGTIVLSLFGDGLRTTVPALVSTVYCLASSPRAQQTLFEEVNSVIGKKQEVTVEDVANLTYLKACVKEALRLFPIGLEVVRLNNKDLVLSGFHIPAGTVIEMNNFNLFSNSSYFKDPESFIPDRWLRGSDVSVVDPYIVMPFGRGPRMCAGRRFAEQDLYVLVSKLIQKFKLDWQGGNFTQEYKILVYPDCDTPFKFEPR